MIKGFIFDADGTILDSMDFWDQTVINLIEHTGIIPDDNLTEILTPMSMLEGAEYIKNKYNLNVSIEEIIERENRIVNDFYSNSVKMRDGTKELLQFLNTLNIPMVIASATDRHLIESALKHLKIFDFFAGIFSCSDTGKGKSSPEIYFTASDFIGTKPNETIVAEDSLQALTTAKNAGFKTLALFDSTQRKNWGKLKALSDLHLKGAFDIEKISRCFKLEV